ncbi:MAG: 3-deoxy-D-manno-octulosonic acid transferase [Desulfobacteraceae bacterium]|nr:3-deoxy-D-manno-octulosonic acid transferase [Desulfobacteraceae bacterium]
MMFYTLLMNFFLAVFVLFFPLIYLFSEKRRVSLLLRFGLGTAWRNKEPGEKRIWVHALSVGEVRSAVPLVKALKYGCGQAGMVFTASTRTGFKTAGQLLLKPGMVDQLGYFPFDFGYSVRKIATLIDPDVVIIVETDIWPNFLYEMRQRRIPVVLVNARLSERSFKGYLRFKRFFSTVFSCLTEIMVQSPLDAARFQGLGINPEKIQVTGNLKFDQAAEDVEGSFISAMGARLNIRAQTLVLVAGSTHEGEEDILFRVYQQLKSKFPALMMILAPRDPRRCHALLPHILSMGLSVSLLSQTPSLASDIVLVDEMGVLSRLYALCHAAYIGGSLVPEGGHNPLEPAAFSKPALFGPDMSDFLLISTLLKDHGGSKQVGSETELAHELGLLLGNPDLQTRMGRLNHEVFLNHSGAVQKILRNLERLHIV